MTCRVHSHDEPGCFDCDNLHGSHRWPEYINSSSLETISDALEKLSQIIMIQTGRRLMSIGVSGSHIAFQEIATSCGLVTFYSPTVSQLAFLRNPAGFKIVTSIGTDLVESISNAKFGETVLRLLTDQLKAGVHRGIIESTYDECERNVAHWMEEMVKAKTRDTERLSKKLENLK